MNLENLRKEYLKNIALQLLTVDKDGIPSNADKHSSISVQLAKGIVERINIETRSVKGSGQTAGRSFEILTEAYIRKSFDALSSLRAGEFKYHIGMSIAEFEQYEHLNLLSKALKTNKELRVILGDYIIKPDIVVSRIPWKDKEINKNSKLVSNDSNANLSPVRWTNSQSQILHASISCKWTLRSDRSQNARTEGLNLIRHRKGRTPHIMIVTGEPYPQRIASLALGTGDIDCVYHFALRELLSVANEIKNEAVSDILDTLVNGKRLRDISDLPFDLTT